MATVALSSSSAYFFLNNNLNATVVKQKVFLDSHTPEEIVRCVARNGRETVSVARQVHS